jgi:hypothetical protein
METKKFHREASKTAITLPNPKESQNNYAFQWLLRKPQAHAVEPFKVHENTRHANTIRR